MGKSCVEFEKWWYTTGIEWKSIEDEEVAKEAWKAALEWVLSHKYGMDGSEIISTEVIEEELENK